MNEFQTQLSEAQKYELFVIDKIQAKFPTSKVFHFIQADNNKKFGDCATATGDIPPEITHWEIKNDLQFKRTGNLFIETRSFNRSGWVHSGIYAPSKATEWLIGDSHIIFHYTRQELQRLNPGAAGWVAGGGASSNPTQGFLLCPNSSEQNFKIFWQG